jgi:hypothetical protein
MQRDSAKTTGLAGFRNQARRFFRILPRNAQE